MLVAKMHPRTEKPPTYIHVELVGGPYCGAIVELSGQEIAQQFRHETAVAVYRLEPEQMIAVYCGEYFP